MKESYREGVIRCEEGIGCFIEPTDDSSAVVSFPGWAEREDSMSPPAGHTIGERVRFTLSEDRITAATFESA